MLAISLATILSFNYEFFLAKHEYPNTQRLARGGINRLLQEALNYFFNKSEEHFQHNHNRLNCLSNTFNTLSRGIKLFI